MQQYFGKSVPETVELRGLCGALSPTTSRHSFFFVFESAVLLVFSLVMPPPRMPCRGSKKYMTCPDPCKDVADDDVDVGPTCSDHWDRPSNLPVRSPIDRLNPPRREDCGSKARGHGSGINWNMSASTCDDDNNRCPKPKDRCAQRDHCGDPPKVKREKKKRGKPCCPGNSCGGGGWFNWLRLPSNPCSSRDADPCQKSPRLGRDTCDVICVKESYRLRSKCSCFKPVVRPVKPKVCPEKVSCSSMDGCSEKSAIVGGKCRRNDPCKAAGVVGHIVDPTSGAAEGVFCNEHGRRAESRRSDDCCPDPCKRVGRGRCSLRRDELEEQGGSADPCASCNPPCDSYTMAAASVLAAGITAAAMYYSR